MPHFRLAILALSILLANCGKVVTFRTTVIANGNWYVATDGDLRLLIRPLSQSPDPEHATLQWAVISGHRKQIEVRESGVWSGAGEAKLGQYHLAWSAKLPGCGYIYLDGWPGGKASHPWLLLDRVEAMSISEFEHAVPPKPFEAVTSTFSARCI